MAEQKNSTKQESLCEVCRLNPSKYKCPNCSLRSCSLPCVKAHKQNTGCTGKRQLTQFVPMSQFDEKLLLSDYSMLEEVRRVAESAQRKRFETHGYSQFRLPFPLKSLRSAAASRKTRLLFLSSGMSKRQTNRSFYNNRKKFISWTIEWRFHSTNVVLLDHGVDENTNLYSVINNHLKPGPWSHQLKQFCDEPLQSLKFFIRKYPKGPKSPFVELDVMAPIREQLANLVIIEYPVINVFLPSHNYDFEVIKPASHQKLDVKKSDSYTEQNTQGVLFREEEIEDANSLDPHVFDLINHIKIPHQRRRTEEKLKDKLDRPLVRVKQETSIDSDAFSIKSVEAGVSENMDFEFDQELLDAYSNLVSEVNPDEFIDFDGVLKKDEEQEKIIDQTDIRGFILTEELEEGEIPE